MAFQIVGIFTVLALTGFGVWAIVDRFTKKPPTKPTKLN